MKFDKLCIILALLNIAYANSTDLRESSKSSGYNPNGAQALPSSIKNAPLKRLQTFLVSIVVKNPELKKKVTVLVEKELRNLGQFIKLKENNDTGFGAQGKLVIEVENVSTNDEKRTVSLISLFIQTDVIIQKTEVAAYPNVLALSAFSISKSDQVLEKNIMNGVKDVLSEFIKRYQAVNPGQGIKPVFYYE